jgi:Serine dehydrogenase proteinase
VQLVERRARYKAIEDYRGRPLIVYATSTRMNVNAMMAGDAVREFIDQLDALPAATKDLDVLVHSTGGDALAAWKLMSILRERFSRLSVIVPFMAFSAATLFALGADEIVIHPHASLGPIDPQITIPQPGGGFRMFAYEDVGAFLRFLSSEAKISEPKYISGVIDKLFSVVDPVHVGAAKRASELSSSVGERLLLLHMKGHRGKTGAKQIAENLNKSFFAHGDAVSRSRARELKLKVADDDKELEKLIWEAFLGLESYMELRQPFIPLQHYLADPRGLAALQPPAPVVLPPNTPPQIAQGVWQAAANQALQNLAAPAVEVPYTIVNALLESTKIAAECVTKGKLSATRNVNGEIQLSGTDTESSWKRIVEPAAPAAPAPAAD